MRFTRCCSRARAFDPGIVGLPSDEANGGDLHTLAPASRDLARIRPDHTRRHVLELVACIVIHEPRHVRLVTATAAAQQRGGTRNATTALAEEPPPWLMVPAARRSGGPEDVGQDRRGEGGTGTP